MNNFTYCSPTRYVFGKGAEQQTGILAKEYLNCPRNVLVVYGRGSVVRSGLLEVVKSKLEEQQISVHLLGGIEPNPTDSKVYDGIAICRNQNIDAVIGVGGGSAIDTAKAIALGAYTTVISGIIMRENWFRNRHYL